MTRWFMVAAMLGAGSLVAEEAFAQEGGSGATRPGADKGGKKKGKKGKKGGDNDGVGPFKKKDYPLAQRLRPLVLPNGMGQITLDLPIVYGSVAGTSSTTFGTNLQFDYGVGDLVEIGLGTGLGLSPDVAWNQTITPRVAFLAYDSKEFDFAPGVAIPLVFADQTAVLVNIDLFGVYQLSEGWFLFFGRGAVPVGVSPDFTLGLNVAGGAGWQLNKKAAFLFGTAPFQLVLVPDVAATGIWETLNASITGQYTPAREWDVGLTLAPAYNLDAEALVFTIDAYARVRF